MLRGLQPKSKMPVDYRKAFLMTREMVFIPQSPSSVVCKPPTPCFRTLSGSGARALLDNLSLQSHRSERHAESVQGGMRESRCKGYADE
ncbi:hypothetical protein M405DRAFT_868334 [Rhizopogon salebrosus TDB-379]|nr:hypothetical protein M405DRAFT_868334 [Rhizopogon salebrosus TDB-379]